MKVLARPGVLSVRVGSPDIKARVFVWVEVFSVCLKAVREHLYAEFAQRYSVEICLPFRICLEFKSTALLLSALGYRMQNHGSIANRFAVVVFHYGEVNP